MKGEIPSTFFFRMKNFCNNIIDRDLTKFPAVIYLALIFFISRIPFINLGFSAFTSPTDQDVLAVVNSAYLLRYEHIYTVSRFPGYPFFEIFNSLLIGGGWILTNFATSVISFLSLILFGKILNQLEIKNRGLLLLTFAFLPVIWINSTITMDYMWALFFVLASCFLVFTGKFHSAGLFMGIAAGTRFTSIFMVIPLIYWMLIKKVESKKIREFILIGFFSSVVMFLPVLYKYHIEFFKGSGFLFTTPVNKPLGSMVLSILSSSANLITELTGLMAFILIIILLFYKNAFQSSEQKHLIYFCWMIVIIYCFIYFIFPYKVAYLIPIIPWTLIIFNEKLKKKYMVMVCILLLLNNIISFNIVSDDPYGIDIDSGSIIKNYESRSTFSINQSREYLESLSITLRHKLS